MLIDKVLICDCDKGYTGLNCQIDTASAPQLTNALRKFYLYKQF